jgi:UDP-N-acetyl-D-glucosamine dehydrogenase
MTILTNGAAYDHAPISVLVEQEATDQVAWIRERIDARDAVVGIVGLGYVGLPLALAFAESGFRVLGLDVDQRRVDSLSEGLSPVGDVSSASIAALVTSPLEVCTAFNRCIGDDGRKRGSLSFTTDFDLAQHVDAAIICVPTPLSASRDPDMSYVIDAATAVGAHLRPGGMVILESTTYPGTTEELVLPILAGPDSARQVGEDFFLAFSPERIDPGRTDHTVRTTPKPARPSPRTSMARPSTASCPSRSPVRPRW